VPDRDIVYSHPAPTFWLLNRDISGATKEQSGFQHVTSSITKNTDAQDQYGISAAHPTSEGDQAQRITAVNTVQDKAHLTAGQQENTRANTKAAGSAMTLVPVVQLDDEQNDIAEVDED